MERAVFAYNPNIPWPRHGEMDLLSLQGGGDSSATPQVAGAAAIWYQRCRKEVNQFTGRDLWEHAELIYQATLRFAQYPANDHGPSKYQFLFGWGVIEASQMLESPPREDWLPKEPKVAGSNLNWIFQFASSPATSDSGTSPEVKRMVSQRVPGIRGGSEIQKIRQQKIDVLATALLDEAHEQLFCGKYGDDIAAFVYGENPDGAVFSCRHPTSKLAERMAPIARDNQPDPNPIFTCPWESCHTLTAKSDSESLLRRRWPAGSSESRAF